MTGIFALVSIAVAALAFAFTLLQLGSTQRAGGLYAAAGTLLLSVALLATRGDDLGIAWLRLAGRRSDAIAFGVGIPLLAMLAGILAARVIRTRWAQFTLTAAALAGTAGSFAAIEIGRSTWYWEFAALLLSGVSLLAVAVPGAVDRTASPNHRVVLATVALMGAFTSVGGVLLTLAWASLPG